MLRVGPDLRKHHLSSERTAQMAVCHQKTVLEGKSSPGDASKAALSSELWATSEDSRDGWGSLDGGGL